MSPIDKELFSVIRRIQIRSRRAVDELLSGEYRSVFKGRGVEFEDVREYSPGDEVRTIDWNITARMGVPFIKNFREERELTVMILVDISLSTLFGTTGRQKRDFVAEIAAALAFSAITNNDRVGLILFSGDIEKYIPPQKGVKHVLRIVRELLMAKPHHMDTNISVAFEFLGKVQKKHGVCFLLSDFIADTCSRTYAVAAKRYDLIGVCITDPRERAMTDMGLVTFRDLETGEERFVDTSRKIVRHVLDSEAEERLFRQKKLMEGVGGGFIDIETGGSYCSAIGRYFRKREKRRI